MDVTYYHLDPMRPPQWRYQHVIKLHSLNRPPARMGPDADPYIWRYHRFFTDLAAAGDNHNERREAINLLPHLAAAHFIYFSDDVFTRQVLQARILARQTDDEIAGLMGIEPEDVEQFEKVFFNVRDRLDASDYILKAAIRSHDRPARSGTDSTDQLRGHTLRLFGYFGGPLIVDFLMWRYRFAGKPPDSRKAHDWLAATFKGTIAVASAAAALDENIPGRRLIKLAIKLAKRRRRRK